MSKMRKVYEDVVEGVRNGKTPLKTAEAVHLLGDRHVRDQYAEVRQEEMGMNKETLKKARESVDAM